MKFIEKYENYLNGGIKIIEIFVYTISFTLISFSIFKAIFIYIIEFNQPEKAFNDSRLILNESIALSLSFILGVEILKLFYINSYKQLIIIISLVCIKLIVNYFLLEEINSIIINT